MNELTRERRIACSAVALALAFVLFRGQLAAAAVTRGDDALRAGDADTAMRLYRRALWIDERSSVAADRIAFHLALRHDVADAQSAIAVIAQATAAGASDPALWADRAFAEVELQRWRDAQRDFERAGALARDARYEHFAARMALHAGNVRAARADATRALALDPSFAPARALLEQAR